MSTKTKKAVDNLDQPNGKASPFERCIPVAVTIHLPGDNRRVERGKVESDADPEMWAAQKKIYKCAEYAAVTSIVGAIHTYLKKKQVPGGRRLFRRGTYPIPLTSLEDVDDRLEQYKAEFNKAVDDFIAVYDERKAEALKRLRSLGDPRDYAPSKRVKAQFGIDHDYLSFGPPQVLGVLNKDLFQRERAKIVKASEDAVMEVKLALRQLFKGLLAHMVERLTPDETGKKKIFKDTLVTNMAEFLADFRDRNITDDAEMAKLVDKCRSIVQGVDPDTLREDNFTRTETAKSLATIEKNLDVLIEAMPIRQMSFDDDE